MICLQKHGASLRLLTRTSHPLSALILEQRQHQRWSLRPAHDGQQALHRAHAIAREAVLRAAPVRDIKRQFPALDLRQVFRRQWRIKEDA